jgi:hypothetical protein
MRWAGRFWLICLLAAPVLLEAQSPFAFQRSQNIPILKFQGANPLLNAWAGGLNAPQFSELDLNGDLVDDLLIFDRSGNKILPFIRTVNAWYYAPEYEALFPAEEHWMLARDYDGDGQKDLFCAAGQGIRVYRNMAAAGAPPEFELTSPLLFSDYGNGLLNLFVNQVDIPSISDIDGDGDLDILTFYILGTCVEYHQNLSMERLGHRDSLIFRLQSDNWGLFTEDAISNGVYLSDSCDKPSGGSLRHTGSTLLADDPDKDGDLDLFLGDISYRELLLLINEPISGKDVIIPRPVSYPAAYAHFEQPVFPAAFRLEDAGNGLPGLLIAPNTDEQSIAADSVCRLYTSDSGAFLYTSAPENFLSDQMIDAGRLSIPYLADLDLDGDLDLLLGNGGAFIPPAVSGGLGTYRATIQLYENTGSNLFSRFVLRNADLAGLSALNQTYLAPAVADMDGDLLPDLIVGRASGGFYYLRRQAPANSFNFQLDQVSFIGLQTGLAPVTCLADMDRDGDLDMIAGNRSGYFQYYENTGSMQLPSFNNTPTIARLGNLETIDEERSNYGYSSPAIFTRNNQNWLFSGSESGRVFLWEIPEAPFSGDFTLLDNHLLKPDAGKRSTLAVADFDGDGLPELICGNYRGGLEYFSGIIPGSMNDLGAATFILRPNPAQSHISWDPSGYWGEAIGEVLDFSGRVLLSKPLAPGISSFETGILPEGIYFFRLHTEHGIFQARFLRID